MWWALYVIQSAISTPFRSKSGGEVWHKIDEMAEAKVGRFHWVLSKRSLLEILSLWTGIRIRAKILQSWVQSLAVVETKTLLTCRRDRHQYNDIELSQFVHLYDYAKWFLKGVDWTDRWPQYIYCHLFLFWYGTFLYRKNSILYQNQSWLCRYNLISIWNFCNADDLSADRILVNE